MEAAMAATETISFLNITGLILMKYKYTNLYHTTPNFQQQSKQKKREQTESVPLIKSIVYFNHQ